MSNLLYFYHICYTWILAYHHTVSDLWYRDAPLPPHRCDLWTQGRPVATHRDAPLPSPIQSMCTPAVWCGSAGVAFMLGWRLITTLVTWWWMLKNRNQHIILTYSYCLPFIPFVSLLIYLCVELEMNTIILSSSPISSYTTRVHTPRKHSLVNVYPHITFTYRPQLTCLRSL